MHLLSIVYVLLFEIMLTLADDSCNVDGCDADYLAQQCREHPNLLIPHPGQCQLYYNCNKIYYDVPRYFEQYLEECSYPLLFSTESFTCVQPNPNQDICGNRKEYKDKCDYRSYWCPTIMCANCELQYPSCTGKKDGFHSHPKKPGSPWYMECQNERIVNVGLCQYDKETHRQLFPGTHGCI